VFFPRRPSVMFSVMSAPNPNVHPTRTKSKPLSEVTREPWKSTTRRRFESGTTVPLAEAAARTSCLELSIPRGNYLPRSPAPRVSLPQPNVQTAKTVRLRKNDINILLSSRYETPWG